MFKMLYSVKDWLVSEKGRPVRFAGLMAFFAAATLSYGRMLIRFRDHLGNNDWDFFSFLHQYWHIAIFSFQQFPFWNPYVAGGMPFFGRPDSGFSPFPVLFVSLFGVVAGFKFMVLFYIFLSMAEMAPVV